MLSVSQQFRGRSRYAAGALCFGVATLVLGIFLYFGLRRRHPGSVAHLDDLSVSVEETLRNCPDVEKVETLVTGLWPTHRIVQINDSHYVSREKFEWFAETIGQLRGHPFTDEAAHDWHQAVADDVEVFQASQARLLCWLADRHGLLQVFDEGIFAENLPVLKKRVGLFRDLASNGDPIKRDIRRLRDDVRACRDPSISRAREEFLEEVRELYLNAGAVGELLVARPWVTVLPAEDKEVFENARSKNHGGRLYGPHFDARNVEIVRRLLAHGPCAVVVLGSAHDLSEEVKAQGWGRCEYIRVTVKNFPHSFDRYFASGRAQPSRRRSRATASTN